MSLKRSVFEHTYLALGLRAHGRPSRLIGLKGVDDCVANITILAIDHLPILNIPGAADVVGQVAVVGAGAKAAAIVARAATLRELGHSKSPDILVFEEYDIGYAWSGSGGFSSGFLTLCTPGEKDVGFPYDEFIVQGAASSSISSKLFSLFSWGAFLVATGRMSDWVDYGRDHPFHNMWAEYLKWVFEVAGQSIIRARVVGVRPIDGRWEISYIGEEGIVYRIVVDGVVLTGTGKPNSVLTRVGLLPIRILDAETFWKQRNLVLELQEGAIAVAGDGGAAGTIVSWLAEHFRERPVSIISISPRGALFPRGDGYSERRWFSDPTDWQELSVEHRLALIERTEAGVVSMRHKSIIDAAQNIEYVCGKVSQISSEYDEILIDINYNGKKSYSVVSDYLISAIGFDRWSLLDLVTHSSVVSLRDWHEQGVHLRREIEENMSADLSLPAISGLPWGLHIPALASLSRGPGMGNLGCLGLMAAAVLSRYVE